MNTKIARGMRAAGLCAAVATAFLHASVLTPARAVAAQDEADWAAVELAARGEGRLVFYSGASPMITAQLARLFEDRYGIPVEVIVGLSSELNERVRAEQGTTKPVGDVIVGGVSSASEHAAAGAFQSYGTLPGRERISRPFSDNGMIVPVYMTSFGMLVNTDAVASGDEPKSWSDILDPKWAGKLLSDSPWRPGAGRASYTVLYDRYGPTFHQQLAALKPSFSTSYTVAERQIGRGEYSLYFPFILRDIVNLSGLPVKRIVPDEGAIFSYQVGAILKRAPHPNAARLFLEFMLSDQVQRVFADRGYISVTDVVSTRAQKEKRVRRPIRLFDFAAPAHQLEMQPVLMKIYK